MVLHPRSAHLRLFLLLLLGASLASLPAAAAQQLGSTAPCAAPSLVKDIRPGDTSSFISGPVDVNGTLFFAANDGSSGIELWKSDGSEAGTLRVADIRPGSPSSSPQQLTAVGGTLFFIVPFGVSEGPGFELWKSDGTGPGTVRVKSFPGMGLDAGARLAVVGSTLFFVAYEEPGSDYELWKSDGTEAGTVRVRDIAPGPSSSFPTLLTPVGNLLFFRADGQDGAGTELWKSDGTEAGTVRVTNIAPGSLSSFPDYLTAVGQTLFFTANVGSGANKLFKSDGTGAVLVKEFSGPGAEPSVRDLTAVGSTLFFVVEIEQLTGSELWKSDGTEAGTKIVRDIHEGSFDAAPEELTALGNLLFFKATDGMSGAELWWSDGTDEGAWQVRDIVPGAPSPQQLLLAPGPGMLLMVVNDGVSGAELWRSDGTAAGTFPMADLMPGSASSNPDRVVLSGQKVFFVATAPLIGEELFTLPFNGVDCLMPSLTCPGDLRVEAVSAAGAVVSYPPAIASDDAPAGLQVEYSLPSGQLFAVGSHTVVATARDVAGNSRTCPFQVTVEDTTQPWLLCPDRVEQEATSPAGAAVNYFVVASDAVTQPLTLEYSHPPGSSFPIQPTEVTVTARDAAGLHKECTFAVVVRDTTAPRLTCPPHVAEVLTSSEQLVVTYPIQVQDAASTPTVSASHPSGSTFPVGETLVTLTASDTEGNSSQCTFRVNLVDPVEPIITCPEPQLVQATKPDGAVVSFPAASAEDNLEPVELSYSVEPGSTFPLGETVVTATARDLSGKTASCTFTVTVEPGSEAPAKSGCQSAPWGASLGWLVLALLPLRTRRRALRR